MFSKILNLRKPGEYPQGISQETIDKVSEFCAKHFGYPLPGDYAKFLKEANGFSYDGRSVFCCYNEEIQNAFPRYSGLDFVTFNTKFYENTDISSYIILGKSSTDYLCYEKTSSKYQILSNGVMNLISESNDFITLLESFFGV